jgi:hypothetical protein
MPRRARTDKRRLVQPFTDDDIFMLTIAPASRQATLASAAWGFDRSLGTEDAFAERWRNHGAPVMERWEQLATEARREGCWPKDERYAPLWPYLRFGCPDGYDDTVGEWALPPWQPERT